jgi:uncharacterized C2H2 Zn-finger protein
MIGALISAGTIFLNIFGFIGDPLFSDTVGIMLGGVIIFSAISYVFWLGNHVKCPQCNAIFKKYSDEHNRSRKVVCPRCGVIWNLGISYNIE